MHQLRFQELWVTLVVSLISSNPYRPVAPLRLIFQRDLVFPAVLRRCRAKLVQVVIVSSEKLLPRVLRLVNFKIFLAVHRRQ